MSYDTWKTRDDRPDGGEEEEDRSLSESEYAIYEIQHAFDVLVEQLGRDRACLHMFHIMRAGKF